MFVHGVGLLTGPAAGVVGGIASGIAPALCSPPCNCFLSRHHPRTANELRGTRVHTGTQVLQYSSTFEYSGIAIHRQRKTGKTTRKLRSKIAGALEVHITFWVCRQVHLELQCTNVARWRATVDRRMPGKGRFCRSLQNAPRTRVRVSVRSCGPSGSRSGSRSGSPRHRRHSS